MATIGDIITALETAVASTGLRNLPLGADPSPPSFEVIPSSGQPRALGAVKETQEFRVRVFVSGSVTRVARDSLDAYLSPTGSSSVRQALITNKHLGLTGVTAVYRGWENYGLFDVNGSAFFGADVLITVEN